MLMRHCVFVCVRQHSAPPPWKPGAVISCHLVWEDLAHLHLGIAPFFSLQIKVSLARELVSAVCL